MAIAPAWGVIKRTAARLAWQMRKLLSEKQLSYSVITKDSNSTVSNNIIVIVNICKLYMTQCCCIDNVFIYQISSSVVSGDFKWAGVDLKAGGDEEKDRCRINPPSISAKKWLYICTMNNGRRVPLKFGRIISRGSMAWTVLSRVAIMQIPLSLAGSGAVFQHVKGELRPSVPSSLMVSR